MLYLMCNTLNYTMQTQGIGRLLWPKNSNTYMYRYVADSVYIQTHISTDYLYTHRIFFITNDVALNIYYIDIHHQLKEILTMI